MIRRTFPHIRLYSLSQKRSFSCTPRCNELRDIAGLAPRIEPKFLETRSNDLLCLQWPSPPRNVLITKKNRAPHINESVIEFGKHITSTYPNVSLILEPRAAKELHEKLPFPIYTTSIDGGQSSADLHEKVDIACSLGGDGTILHTASLFATTRNVPPVLSFSMGTLGFLGEWKFKEYKRAFREVYMSGASAGYGSKLLENENENGDNSESDPHSRAAVKEGTGPSEATPHEKASTPAGWSSIRGKSMGSHRGSRILLRNRLKVGIYGPDGKRVPDWQGDVYAMNEVTMHRGAAPHLTIIEISIGGRFLTEGVSDGIIVATPTGSTAYSLSSGGSIVHPLVPSLLMTPICARSLSFRPLVLPANTPISLRLSEKNRADEVEVSIDGVRRSQGLKRGMEIRVWGEGIRSADGLWSGGVPSVVRGANGSGDVSGEDHWVGGLNGLLKFNYPFGEV